MVIYYTHQCSVAIICIARSGFDVHFAPLYSLYFYKYVYWSLICTFVHVFNCQLGPTQFLTCPGNNQIPQEGCSDVEVINETEGGTITFDVSVVNDPISGSCYNQSIESVAIRRVDSNVN